MPPVPLIKASLWDILCGKKGCFLFFTLLFFTALIISPLFAPMPPKTATKSPLPSGGHLEKPGHAGV